MSQPKWTDGTSYSYDEKKRTPRVWELRVSWLRLIVHKWGGLDPNLWFGTCHELNIKNLDLGTDLEQAKSLLIMTLKDKLHSAYGELAKL